MEFTQWILEVLSADMKLTERETDGMWYRGKRRIKFYIQVSVQRHDSMLVLHEASHSTTLLCIRTKLPLCLTN
jgi:hypothetical protein